MEQLELELAKRFLDWTDMMALGRLKFLQKVYGSDVVTTQIVKLEARLWEASGPVAGSAGQPAEQSDKDGPRVTGSNAP